MEDYPAFLQFFSSRAEFGSLRAELPIANVVVSQRSIECDTASLHADAANY